MFDIPIGARHIVIEENETSPHIIGECVSNPFPALEHEASFFFFLPNGAGVAQDLLYFIKKDIKGSVHLKHNQ